MQFNNVMIKGTGKALPSNKFSNEDLVNWHGRKSADWIYEKIQVVAAISKDIREA